MTPTTIATITFEGDYRMAVLQVLSVERLFDLTGVREYIVVVNTPGLKDEIGRLLWRVVGKEMIARLRLVEPPDLGQTGQEKWRGQQILKLALVGRVHTDTYLMLDAKNHFVRPASLEDFYLDGQPVTRLDPISPYWRTYLDASMDALGVDKRPDVMMPSVTPYLLLTAEVRELVAQLEDRYEAPLAQAMAKTGKATEFLLYYAHLLGKHGTVPYTDAAPVCETMFATWPPPEGVLPMIERAHDRVMFGLHRLRIPTLTEEHRAAVVGLWRRYLLKPWEDGGWFLHTDPPPST